jgi:hypothetical protein
MAKPEKTDEEFEAHFWNNVQKSDGCWLWTGARDGKGYGKIWRRGKHHRAHRISCKLSGKEIPEDKLACHHCDVKLCVRPDHIFSGTGKDNMQDWTKKGKNILINNPLLLKRGNEHWTRKDTKNSKNKLKMISDRRKNEWASGKRVAIRDNKGRIMGTRMMP